MAEGLVRPPQKDINTLPTNVNEWKKYLSSPENDLRVFEDINSLRQNVESPENWIKIKELAKQELTNIPENVIPQIFKKLKPYLEEMPGGHSKKHVYRDFINSLLIDQDPWVRNSLDDVEKFIGIMGGAFHDIGNSVAGRYEETTRFAAHAETGAYLFGKLAEDLFQSSPNLLKLSQFAIAAHTHYLEDITVTREGLTVIREPYADALDNKGNKAGIWLARWADRLDMQGVQAFIRSAITRVEPTKDYNGDDFIMTTFEHNFTPSIQEDNVLEHITRFRNNALEESIYSQHDTPYFTNDLVKPNAEEQEEFIREVLRETPDLSKEEIDREFGTFYTMCRRVDDGSNIEAVIGLFKRTFRSRPPNQLSHWANGFSVLPKLYNQMLSRMENKLQEASNDQSRSGIFREANKLAFEILEDLKKIS